MNAKKRTPPGDSERAEPNREILHRYCIEESELKEELVVPCRSIVTLSASPRHASHRPPRVVTTRDLDELKAWIGIDDQAVPNRCLAESEHRREMKSLCRMCNGENRQEGDSGDFRARVHQAERAHAKNDSIRAHARSYLYGDSRLVQEAKPVIERFFVAFSVYVWAFPDIRVKSGSVLAVGPGANTLIAKNIEIEEGGRIVSIGSLTARALSAVRKITPPSVFPTLADDYIFQTAFREVN
jgi:hypothetical protein